MDLLKKYADIVVQVGLNIQKGERLEISSDIHAAEFVRAVVKSAYEQGAKSVKVDYEDGEVNKLHYTHQEEATLIEFPKHLQMEQDFMIDEKIAYLKIESQSPELYKDLDDEKMNKVMASKVKNFKKVSDSFGAFNQTWCIVGYPSIEWAELVYPELKGEAAKEKLLNTFFKIMRLNETNPVDAWKQHIEHLKKVAKSLSDKGFDYLHYTAPGTDLKVGLIPGAKWVGADEVNGKGTNIVVNMPTEEIFTSPDYRRVDGYVTNSLPLSVRGKIIDDFKLTFKDGVVIDYSAKQGLKTLEGLLSMDDGMKRLGEIALVPVDTPIYQSGTLYYNTLYDENASCHLAIGDSFPHVLEGAQDKSTEEQMNLGFNDSISHIDFMIGSEALNIDGYYKDGTSEPVFRNGLWAIQ